MWPVHYLFFGLFSFSSLSCAHLPKSVAETASEPTPVRVFDTELTRSLQPIVEAHPGTSGFYALNNPVDALAARLALIEQAGKSIDVQYYIWHDDYVGRAMYLALLQAAERGVSVRVLLDDLDTKGKDELLLQLNLQPNLEIRVFNPFAHRNHRWLDFLTNPGRVNHRMHNKAFIVDNAAAVVGGRNIGSEYFGGDGIFGFSDMDVLAVGPVTQDVATSFDEYWSSAWVYKLNDLYKPLPEPNPQELKRTLGRDIYTDEHALYVNAVLYANENFQSLAALDYSWGQWQLVYDYPGKLTLEKIDVETHLAPQLQELVNQAKRELIIVSPYFVPGEKVTEFLVTKAKAGVRVRILTNSLAANDVGMVHAGYRRYRRDLIAGGIELYEFKPEAEMEDRRLSDKVKSLLGASGSSLHAKMFGVDRQFVFVGSFNLDGRSVHINTELGVYFKSSRYGEALSALFDSKIPSRAYRVSLNEEDELRWTTSLAGQQKVYTKEPETSAWQRFVNKVLSWIVPEKQL